jgi:hypothetical protein
MAEHPLANKLRLYPNQYRAFFLESSSNLEIKARE